MAENEKIFLLEFTKETLLKEKKVFAWTMAVFVGLAIVFLIRAPVMYEASTIIAPAYKNITGEQNSVGSSGGGLSSILSMGGIAKDTVSTFSRFKITLKSQILAERLDEKHGLLKTVYLNEWNEAEQKWEQPGGIRNMFSNLISGVFGIDTWAEPSMQRLSKMIGGIVVFTPLKEQGVFKVSIRHPNPAFAKMLLSAALSEADNLLKENDQKKSLVQIEYLQKRLKNVGAVVHQQNLLGLLVREEAMLMSSSVNLPYGAELYDEVKSSELPVSPNPTFAFMIALLLGFIFAFFIVYARQVRNET